MFPPWMLSAFYVVSGVAVVWLLMRVWQKRQVSQHDRRSVVPETRPTPPRPSRPSEPITAATTRVETPVVTPSPIPAAAPLPAVSILKTPEAVTPTVMATSTTSTSSNTPPVRAWERKLGLRPEALKQPLPFIRPSDVPSVRTDDLAYGGLTPTLAAMLPDSEPRRDEARKELHAAGFYQPHAFENLAATRYLLMMLGLVIGGVALILAPQRLEWLAVISIIALPLLGWAFPRLYVRGQAAERRSQIEQGMPDLLDMLNMCVSQGLTITDSLSRILRDLRGPYPALAQELRIVTEQASLAGLPTALNNFSKRVDIPEVHSFTSLINQTERMGTSVTEALKSHSDTMRESLRQRTDEKGNRATFRLLFPTVFCLMPAVYLFLLGPAIVELSKFFYEGGRASLDQGSGAIARLNAIRRTGPVPDPNAGQR